MLCRICADWKQWRRLSRPRYDISLLRCCWLCVARLTIAYSSEVLPYGIRAKGLSLCLGVTALSGVLNQYVNPIGLAHLAWKFYFVYIVILVIEVACIWFLFVETKGPTLEELAYLFDGDDAQVTGVEGSKSHPITDNGKASSKVDCT